MIFEYRGQLYPEYLKHGNAAQFIAPSARFFCQGKGLDVGASDWPLEGAIPVERRHGGDAMDLPKGPWDYIFSSHCLEHLENPIAALKHWIGELKEGGCLFLYLPHPDMEYWRPQFCEKHLHYWWPEDMADILSDLGLRMVMNSERDFGWGFTCVGFR